MRSIAREMKVRETVQLFYDAFNTHDFNKIHEFTSEDWVHINPFGGWTRSREIVITELKEVHSTFLKDVTDTPEDMDVRFASMNVAIVTVPSEMSPHTTPDGVHYENQKQIRTFILVKRGTRWFIVQDQNTSREH